jgi:hypothetical protein
MDGVYNNVPEANQFPRACNVSAVECLHLMVRIMSFPMLNVLYFYLTVVLSEV